MDAKDVGSGEDGGCVGGGRGLEAGVRRVQSQRADVGRRDSGEEAFAGEAGEDGLMQLVECVEVGEEGIVFVEALAEAEAGVEDDLVARDACGEWRLRGGRKAGEDERENFVGSEGGLVGQSWGRPRVCMRMAPQPSWAQVCGHGGVPEMAADVVDDLGSGGDGALGGGGVVGVDREDGVGRCWRMASMTGRMRDCSSSGVSGVALGRVDSPPMSRRSAPSSSIWRAWATARAGAFSGE